MAITVNKDRVKKLSPCGPFYFTLTTAEAVVAGALLSLDATGKAKNAATTDGYGCIGVAQNAAASGGLVRVEEGIWEVTSSDIGIDDIGKNAYITDNDACQLTSNSCLAGPVKVVEGTRVFVKLGK